MEETQKESIPLTQTKFWKLWKKYGEPITAISIIIFIVFSAVMIHKDRQLKLEINEHCGWGEEDYRCYCEKSKAIEIENKMKYGGLVGLDVGNLTLAPENVSLDR